MANTNLKQKATSGMMWTAIQKYTTMGIQFISGVILARLLTPYDYGCIGMLAIFMMLAESFVDCGFGSALIQKKQPSQVDYSTIFFWNIGVSLIMYAILFFSAPSIARFYGISMLCDVLRVQGVVVIIYALKIIQANQLRKKFNFRILSIVTIVTSVVALCITIIMAYNGYGVWALVAQNIITALIPCVIYWFFIKWRPSWVFSVRSFKELFSFGVYMFFTQLVNRFGQQLQGLLIGKIYNPATMGYYSKANSTERLASSSISQIMTQVTFPLYAEAQDDKKAICNMIKRLTMTLSFITFPLLFILLLLAKPIFVLLYSERWLQSVPYFQVLCIAGLAFCLMSVNTQSVNAIGKSRLMFVWTLIRRTIGIGLIVGGLFLFGMKGLLIGAVISEWFSYLVNVFIVSKHIGYKWWRQLLDLLPILSMSVLAAGISYFIGLFFDLPMYYDALLKLAVFALIYLGWSFVFKPEAYQYCKTIIEPLKSKLKKKNKLIWIKMKCWQNYILSNLK